MKMLFGRWTKSCVARFLRSEQGGIAAYAGIFMTLALGGAALAVDFGRLAVLRTQMQDSADAGALARATQLVGLSVARARAASLSRNAMRKAARPNRNARVKKK